MTSSPFTKNIIINSNFVFYKNKKVIYKHTLQTGLPLLIFSFFLLINSNIAFGRSYNTIHTIERTSSYNPVKKNNHYKEKRDDIEPDWDRVYKEKLPHQRKYAEGYPNKYSEYENVKKSRGGSLYVLPNMPSEGIYSNPKESKLIDLYADYQITYDNAKKSIQSVLNKYKYSRGPNEIFFSVGAQLNAFYDNTFGTPKAHPNLRQEFAALNTGIGLGLGFVKRFNDKMHLEIRGGYAYIPFSYIFSNNLTDTDSGHIASVSALLRANSESFGVRKKDSLWFAFAVDNFYNNTSNIYNKYNIFPIINGDIDIHGTITREFFNYFGVSFMTGFSIGKIFKDNQRFTLDVLLGVGPTIFMDNMKTNNFGIHQNAGVNISAMLNLAHHIRVKKSSFWVTFELRNRLRVFMIPEFNLPLLQDLHEYTNPLSVFVQTEASVGGLVSF